MCKIITYLNENNIAFAVLKGVHDEDSYQMETKEFKADLDIVLSCNRKSIIVKLIIFHVNLTYRILNIFWIPL